MRSPSRRRSRSARPTRGPSSTLATSACAGTATNGSSSSASGMHLPTTSRPGRPSTLPCRGTSTTRPSTRTGGGPTPTAVWPVPGPSARRAVREDVMRTKLFMLFPLAGLAVAVIGVPASQGADPFVAGGPSSRMVALDRTSSDRALGRAVDLRRALGLGGTRQTIARLDDRFDHRVYDEVVSFDAHGREVALTRLDTNGALLLAIRLGWSPGSGRPISADAAAGKAAAIVGAAGLTVGGTSEVHPSQGAGGWVVRWPPTGPLAERMQMLEFWLDAGDGALIGGDIAE